MNIKKTREALDEQLMFVIGDIVLIGFEYKSGEIGSTDYLERRRQSVIELKEKFSDALSDLEYASREGDQIEGCFEADDIKELLK